MMLNFRETLSGNTTAAMRVVFGMAPIIARRITNVGVQNTVRVQNFEPPATFNRPSLKKWDRQAAPFQTFIKLKYLTIKR